MAKNNIIFPELEFKKAGVYTYKIRELSPRSQHWVIDKTEYRVVVTVTDDGAGKLHATLDYPDGFIQFCNVFYEKPLCECHKTHHPHKICESFLCMSFPIFVFMPPQKTEFNEIMEIDPCLFERWSDEWIHLNMDCFNDENENDKER